MREMKLCNYYTYQAFTNSNSPEYENPIYACRMADNNKPYCFLDFHDPDECTNFIDNFMGMKYNGNELRIKRAEKFDGLYVGPRETYGRLQPSQTSQSNAQLNYSRGSRTSRFDVLPSNSSNSYSMICLSSMSEREIFVGNITDQMTEQMLQVFLGGALRNMSLALSTGNNNVLKIFGLNEFVPTVDLITVLSKLDLVDNNPVIAVRHHSGYSFVELRTPEDASNLLNLDGVPFMGSRLKISRNTKFNSKLSLL